MKILLKLCLVSFLTFGSSGFSGERELVRCQRVIDDEKAHDIFYTIMPGRPSEMVTVCGSYKGGDGKGGEARGFWFNWYFIRSLTAHPDEVVKVYIHRVNPNSIQLDDGKLVRFAYSGDGFSVRDMLAFTTKIATKSVVISYVDEQSTLREKELFASELESK